MPIMEQFHFLDIWGQFHVEDGLWGILHEHWKVDFIFEEIGEFHLVGPDFAEFPVAKYNGFWGVGFPNNALVPFVYDYIGHFACDGEEVLEILLGPLPNTKVNGEFLG